MEATPDHIFIYFDRTVALALPIHSLDSGSEELVLLTQVLHSHHHPPISPAVPSPTWVLESFCEQMETSVLPWGEGSGDPKRW